MGKHILHTWFTKLNSVIRKNVLGTDSCYSSSFELHIHQIRKQIQLLEKIGSTMSWSRSSNQKQLGPVSETKITSSTETRRIWCIQRWKILWKVWWIQPDSNHPGWLWFDSVGDGERFWSFWDVETWASEKHTTGKQGWGSNSKRDIGCLWKRMEKCQVSVKLYNKKESENGEDLY